MMHETLLLAGVGIVALAWLGSRAAGAAPPPSDATPAPGSIDVDQLPGNRQLTAGEVRELAETMVARHGLRAPVPMLVTMAWIESNFRPWVTGFDGLSFGLMQLRDEPRSKSTALWLARDMGFNAYGTAPTRADLVRPQVSMYLGAAYVHWLARYQGVARSEEWVVRAYNGGPNWNIRRADESEASYQSRLANTLNHWSKYKRAKPELGY